MRKQPIIILLRGLQGLTGIGALSLVAIVFVGYSQVRGYITNCDSTAWRLASAQADLKCISTALAMYQVDRGNLPTTEVGLRALVDKGGDAGPKTWKGPYLDDQRVLRDPWGHGYVYRCLKPEGGFELVSLGPDGVAGTDDDIQELRRYP